MLLVVMASGQDASDIILHLLVYAFITIRPFIASALRIQNAEPVGKQALEKTFATWHFCTTDQMFIGQTLMQQPRLSKCKLSTRFVDFKKAFSSLPRCAAYKFLEERGMRGKNLISLNTTCAADVCLSNTALQNY